MIYRHQVLKQADVVLAMVLRSDQFPLDQKRRNFDYYDPITTGDSSLSACVQAMAAAQIGYDELAVEYFREALFVDLADTHGNASDGVHVASCGGVWGTIAFGFAGLFDTGTALRFTPSLPSRWEGVTFRMQRHGSRMLVELDADGCTVDGARRPPGADRGSSRDGCRRARRRRRAATASPAMPVTLTVLRPAARRSAVPRRVGVGEPNTPTTPWG